jgi:hypothetical protein
MGLCVRVCVLLLAKDASGLVTKYTHPIWHAIKDGKEEEAREFVREDPQCLALRGDVGET